jgi:hypothetical protein
MSVWLIGPRRAVYLLGGLHNRPFRKPVGVQPSCALKTAFLGTFDALMQQPSVRRHSRGGDEDRAQMRRREAHVARQSQALLIEARPGVRSSRAFIRKSATPSVTTALCGIR